MIIPYGHERTTVRRLPWVTFGLMAACVLVFLGSIPATGRAVRVIEERANAAVEYFSEHPYLELDAELRGWFFRGVDDEEVEMILEMARRQAVAPYDPRVLEREQETMDELGRGMIGAIRSLPHFRLGLVPDRLRPHGFITYQFMHGGWLHLIGNLFIFFVVGPFIEDVWGRPLFAGFYLAAGVFAAAFFAMRYPEMDAPLVGASGAVAGVMAAFGIRYWRTRVRFLVWLIVPIGKFAAPAVMVFPLWFAWEFLMARSMDAIAPHAGGGGVAHWAHVAGFAFGVAAAVGIRHFRIEERFIDRAIEDKITLVDNTAVEAALAKREDGRHDEAMTMLEDAVGADPENVDAAVAYWTLAVDHGRAAEAAPAVLRVIRRALRDGESDLAVSYWQELSELAPGAVLDPAVGVRMAELLADRNDSFAAGLTIDRLAAQGLEGVPGGVLARLARLSATLGTASSGAIMEAAVASPDLPPDALSEIARLEVDSAAAVIREPAPAETEVVEDPAPIEVVVAARAREIRVLEATPTRLEMGNLTLRVGEGSRVLSLGQVQAVAVVGISGADQRPYLLIDLLLDPPWSELESLRVVRLLGSSFDPRAVVGGDDPMPAFRRLLATILDVSEAVPLPDPEAARGNPFRMYGSVAAYERELLGARSA